ncbi:MAG: HIT family protein [Candidatus Rokubacteria bacterium]|nr:HIT family protein [Candidatus Rokubacteria bacterium]MBI2493792.1 HIT family protein [Candidatus Rokubacteria bacterium]
MDTCVFCKIRDGQIPSMRVYEDERTFCIMDINPLSPGHCLVISKAHAPTIYEAEPADLEAAIATAQRVALALRDTIRPEGLNLLQANGGAAFQSVPHFHLHLIPRWMRDGKGFDWKLVPGQKDEIVKVGDQLRAALGGDR